MLKSLLRKSFIKLIKEERMLRWLNVDGTAFPRNILEKYGYYETVRTRKPIDLQGNHLPWFTYPAIEYLKQLDLSQKTVLEWGCGNSSLFFAKRVSFIDSVEDDTDWYNEIKGKLPRNAALHLVNDSNYISIAETLCKKYDIIIIDAKRRDECAKVACNYLNQDGVIIIDNSDWFKNSSKTIRENDFIEVDFHGFGPINDYAWTTSIFFSRTSKLKPIGDIQPDFAIGGLQHISD